MGKRRMGRTGSVCARGFGLGLAVLALHVAGATPALAQGATEGATVDSTPPIPETENKELVEARDTFRRGAEFVASADWSEALAAFERSAALRAHPVTTFNIAVCQRALGQYMRARSSFQDALTQDEKAGGQLLSETLATQARAFKDEIERMLVTVKVRLTPLGARIAVDGRPLEQSQNGKRNLLLAGVRPPGRGERAPGSRFDLLAEPGARVFVLSHPGFGDIVVKRTFAPGSSNELNLELARLPADLRIEADRPGAVVSVADVDVGVAPVKISRPAGEYDVVVKKPGFVTYETRVLLKPGGQADLRAKLPEVEPVLTDRWWFWAAAGVVVVGAAVTTYALTRPDPERPPPNGGTLGWVVDVR
jgi:hypothetical protein